MRNSIFLFVLTLGLAVAQPSNVPADRQDILDYPLTLQRASQLIAAVPEMTRYVISLPPEVLKKAATRTRAEQIANLEKDPKAMAIVKQHALTAKEYIVGVPALRMALWLADGRATPSTLVFASPANLAFAKANLSQLKPKWDAIDGGSRPSK